MSNDLKEFDHFFGESKLSTKERNRLDDKTFGIPDERKYPLNDKSHVIQAARMFNKADEKDKPELAKRILKKAKEFNIDTSRWKLINEYYDESNDIEFIEETKKPYNDYLKYHNYNPKDNTIVVNGKRVDAGMKGSNKERNRMNKFLRENNYDPKNGTIETRIPNRDGSKYRTRFDINTHEDGSDDDRVNAGSMDQYAIVRNGKVIGRDFEIGMSPKMISQKPGLSNQTFGHEVTHGDIYMHPDKYHDELIETRRQNRDEYHRGDYKGGNKDQIEHAIDPEEKVADYHGAINNPYGPSWHKTLMNKFKSDEDKFLRNTTKKVQTTEQRKSDVLEKEREKEHDLVSKNSISDHDRVDNEYNIKQKRNHELAKKVIDNENRITKSSNNEMNNRQSYVQNRINQNKHIKESFVQEYGNSNNNELIPIDKPNYDEMYFGSPTKYTDEIDLDRPLFVSPFKGISSIFIWHDMDLQNKIPKGSYNIQYEEWLNFDNYNMNEPLKEVHVYVEGAPFLEPFTIEQEGYIHCINAKDYANNFYKYEWMADDLEYLIANTDDNKVNISNVIKTKVKYYIQGKPTPAGKNYGPDPKYMLQEAKDIAERIHEKKVADEKDPTGNQNCQLCTWCAEANFRGIDILPRPVYSPRDTIFDTIGESIVKNPVKIIPKNLDDIVSGIKEAGPSRWYTHVNWKDSEGGHEFLLLNINFEVYVMDPQQGFVTHIDSDKGSAYFNDINYSNSYVVRLDNKELNESLLRENNDPSKTLEWDEELDIPYMREQGMIAESFVQEGAWQDIINGVNPWSMKRVFHISKQGNLDGRVFKPRVPEYLNDYDPNDIKFEDSTNPRVCFSPSIEGCLNAILVSIARWKTADKLGNWYVYIPEKPLKEYKHKTTKELIKNKHVYDANITDEIWIEEPVRLKQYGIIRIDQVSNKSTKKTVPTLKGDKGTRNKYSFKWHWLVKPKVLKDLPYDYTPTSVCEDMLFDLSEFGYGIIKNGKLSHGSAEDFDKYYRLQTPEEFEQHKGGICFDYVEYQDGYLESYGFGCRKFYMYTNTKYNDTHTFMILEDNSSDKKYIWPEVSYEPMRGVHKYNSIDEIFKEVAKGFFKINNNDKNQSEIKYYVWEYTGHPEYGSNMVECTKYYSKGEPIAEGTVKNKKKIVKESYVMNNTERCERYQGIDFNMFDDEPDIVHKSTRTISDFLSTFMEDGEEPVETSEVEEETVEVEEEPQQQFGSDTSDVQNEYDQRDVVTLNDLIAAESQALSEYLDAAKNTSTQLLSRLYSDIGNEERFHLEQLMYAKSTITGEKYVPRDPDVKKEYEELLSTGMDEETAMTTAVDKYGIGMANKQPVEQELEMEELDAVEQDLDMMESFMNVWDTQYSIMYEQMTMKHINVTLMKSYMEFFNTMSDNSEYIFEAVTDANVAAKQLSRNPIKMIWQAFKTVYKFIISIVKKFKTFFDRIRISAKDKREFISRHGIGALFGEGPSLYFWSDKTGKFDEQAPAQYIFLMNSIIEKVIEAATINGIQKPHQTLPPAQQIPFGTMNDGVKKLRGALLTKTKVIVTNDNTEYLEDAFFGVDTRGGNQINSTVKDSKNTNMSSNIYNKLLLILEDLEISAKSADAVLETLNAMPGMQNTLYQNNQSKWNESVNAMKEVVRSFNIFTKAVTNDVNQCVKLNNGLLELMQNYDASRKDLKLPSKDAADAVNKYKEERSKRLHPTDEKGNPISTVTVGTGTSAK